MKNILEVENYVSVINLGSYDGIMIIGDEKKVVRNAKDHNKFIEKLKRERG